MVIFDCNCSACLYLFRVFVLMCLCVCVYLYFPSSHPPTSSVCVHYVCLVLRERVCDCMLPPPPLFPSPLSLTPYPCPYMSHTPPPWLHLSCLLSTCNLPLLSPPLLCMVAPEDLVLLFQQPSHKSFPNPFPL